MSTPPFPPMTGFPPALKSERALVRSVINEHEAVDSHPRYQSRNEKGAADGYAGLDAGGGLAQGQTPIIPASTVLGRRDASGGHAEPLTLGPGLKIEGTEMSAFAEPIPYGTHGHYRVVAPTGIIAAGAPALSEFLQFRWPVAPPTVAVIQRVWIAGLRQTNWGNGILDIGFSRATAWTVPGTGGVVVAVADPQLQLRPPTMGPSLAEIRIADTAPLGVGTKVLDTRLMGLIAAAHRTAGGPAVMENVVLPSTDELFVCDLASGEHPLVLSQNEGFVVRLTVPGGGTWQVALGVRWAETDEF